MTDLLDTMTIDDKRAWLTKHGVNVGWGINPFEGQSIKWSPKYNGNSKYTGVGKDGDASYDDLFNIVVDILFKRCL